MDVLGFDGSCGSDAWPSREAALQTLGMSAMLHEHTDAGGGVMRGLLERQVVGLCGGPWQENPG